MSEAIVAFQSQLTGIMETVLKAAVHEITFLVDRSFQGEVVRSRKEVETLKQRLQSYERRHREQERGAKFKCNECGRLSGLKGETRRKVTGTQHVEEQGCSVKEEKITAENRGSCLWEPLATAPPSVPDETSTLSSTAFGETLSDFEGDNSDFTEKKENFHEGENDVAGAHGGQGTWLETTVHFNNHTHPEDQWPTSAEHSEEPGQQPTMRHKSEELGELQQVGLKAGPGCSTENTAVWNCEHITYKKVTVLMCDDPEDTTGEPDFSSVAEENEKPRLGLGGVQQSLNHSGEHYEAIRSENAVGLSHPHGVATDNARRKNPKKASGRQPHFSSDGRVKALGWGSTGQAGLNLRRDSASGQCEDGGFADAETRAPHGDGAGDGPNVCVYCGKRFAYISRLKIHLLKHTGEKPFSCSQCGKSFTVARNLERHQRIHWGDADLFCPQCGKSFRRADHLKVHQRVHTGERPYCCTHCNKSFRFSGDLNTHRRVHTGEKPYCCKLCGVRFGQLRQLKSHMRGHLFGKL